MEEQNYGIFRVGQLCNIDIKELMQYVVEKKVDVTITFEPDRTEISVTPWRPNTPSCPYAGEKHDC